MPHRRRHRLLGDGGGREPGDESGNETYWRPSDFIPAWTESDEVFSVGDPVPFGANAEGNLPQYLPLYINNDGRQDGPDILILSLNSDTAQIGGTAIGFSQETYILKEEWDEQPGNPDISENFTTQLQISQSDGSVTLRVGDSSNPLEPLEPSDALTTVTRIDETTRPNETPQLVAGSKITAAVVIIEDAGSEGTIPVSSWYGSSENDVQWGTKGNDVLLGSAGDDVLHGTDEEGNDVLFDEAGNEIDGNDALLGEAGNDVLYGGDSGSALTEDGDLAYDYLNGGSGHDTLYGEAGSDFLEGMAGNDHLWGGSEEDILRGRSGNDTLDGGNDYDRIDGGRGNDQLIGAEGDDFLNGYGRIVTNDSQIDTLIGGEGVDSFILGGEWGVSYVETGDGYAIVQDLHVEDQIQVFGEFSQYDLVVQSVNGIGSSARDTEIYYIGNGQRDRIGIVQDTIGISINDSGFVLNAALASSPLTS